MIYVHPVLGAIGAAAMFVIAFLGFRARHREPYAPSSRARHRQLAPWVYAFVAATAAIGTSSVLLFRPKLQVAGSPHFWVMWGMVALMTAAALLSLRFRHWPWARTVHPWLGIAATMLAILGVMMGIALLP